MASQNQHTQHSQKSRRESEHNGETHFGGDILRDTIEEFKERSEDAKTLVTEYVKDKPFRALGIAAAAGVVLALLMKR
ncbi:MAG: hypothetical protein H0U71_06685 [Gammaproteobacteria bacterium]|nr:hypothetical protein [Gammaproteobacteria bacterium]